jgi:hypothetical protein
MPFFFFDPTMIILIPAIILSIYASVKVQATYNKYKRIASTRGLSGSDVAQLILHNNGISDVKVEQIPGMLSDHYDPRTKVLRLSPENYSGRSLAAIGVAAHEVGHAVQHAQGYAPLGIRNAIVPVTSLGSNLAIPLIFIGLIFNTHFMGLNLLQIGVILYSTVVLFTLITLPVEFNASRRAVTAVREFAILNGDEIEGARRVLNAAALTYVAATTVAILELLRLLIISRGFGKHN